MKISELIWTFGLICVGIIGVNVLIRALVGGVDAALDFTWLGTGIALLIAGLVTVNRARQLKTDAHRQS